MVYQNSFVFIFLFCTIFVSYPVPSTSFEFPTFTSFFGKSSSTRNENGKKLEEIPPTSTSSNNSRFGALSDMIIEAFTTSGGPTDDTGEDEYYDYVDNAQSEFYSGASGLGGLGIPLGIPQEFNPQEGFQGALVPDTWYGLVPYGIEGTVVVITAIIMLGITLVGFGFLAAWACGIQKYFPLILKPRIDEPDQIIITTTPAPFLLGLFKPKPLKPFKPLKPLKPLFSKPGLLSLNKVAEDIEKLDSKYSDSDLDSYEHDLEN